MYYNKRYSVTSYNLQSQQQGLVTASNIILWAQDFPQMLLTETFKYMDKPSQSLMLKSLSSR